LKSDQSLRVGIVPYTNAFPLKWYLPELLKAEYSYEVPSKLGQELAWGHVDVALLSTIELLSNPDYGYISEVGVCSNGAVKSVCVFSEKKPEEWKTLALDKNSLVSVVLLQVLLDQYWGVKPELISYTPPVKKGLETADAALAIGDPCLAVNDENLMRYDLGKAWKAMTGLPFVFALWVTRPEIKPDPIKSIFIEAKTRGMDNLDTIAQSLAEENGPDKAFYLNYFQNHIVYDVGEQELAGMRKFFELAKPYAE